MKAQCIRILSVLAAAAVLLTALHFSALAAPQADEEPQHYTEITVQSSEIQAKGAFKAIQLALNAARYSATKDNIYKVVVEPGSYVLRSALHIYSNTTLSLNRVTLKRHSDAVANMVRVGDDTAINKGATGYDGYVNVTVEGGTLNGGATSNTMVKVTHASNFQMIGTELINVKNAHMMEIAAVDGFNIQNCTFKNQVLDVGEVGYEAIQLDIPKEGHIIGARSEALAVRNVSVTGCTFTNVPRAIGSHTHILNVPYENIVISDNTFTDIKSVAIQTENWKNVKIINNTIDNTPRAVAVYSLLGDGAGGYKPSVLAKEGKTETSASDSYSEPFNANILISRNLIKNCGTAKDAYAGYEPLAISVIGEKLTKTGKTFPDGAGGYPKGDYYLSGVSVSDNNISSSGHCIYLDYARNVRVTGNTLTCVKNSRVDKPVNPLTSVNVTFASIGNNVIKASDFHGMELAYSAIAEISGNHIGGVAQDGILLEAESVVTGSITDNFIEKAGRYGINVRPYSDGGTIRDNIIAGSGKGSVQKEKNAKAVIGDNYYEIAKMTSLTLNRRELTLGTDEKFKLVPTYAPVNAAGKFSWSSSDPKTVNVDQKGVVTARQFGEADITATSADGKTAACHVKVLTAPQSIQLSDTMLTIGTGETVQLESILNEGSFSNGVSYVSNNTGAVTVHPSLGVITGVGSGTATVVAKTYNGKHACCNVIVKDAPYDVWFDRRDLNLGVGEITSLRLVLPEGSAAHNVVFASDNESVVSVEQNGSLIAKTVGEATVTATAYNGTVAICRVAVKNEPDEVAFEQAEYSLAVGESLQPSVVFAENTASDALSFQSSDPDICKVDKTTGELTAKKAGVVTLTVKTYNHVAATCKVTVV